MYAYTSAGPDICVEALSVMHFNMLCLKIDEKLFSFPSSRLTKRGKQCLFSLYSVQSDTSSTHQICYQAKTENKMQRASKKMECEKKEV